MQLEDPALNSFATNSVNNTDIVSPTGSKFYAVSQHNTKSNTIQFYFFNSVLDASTAFDKLKEEFSQDEIKGFNLYQPDIEHEVFYSTVIDCQYQNFELPFSNQDKYGFSYDFNYQRNWQNFLKSVNLYQKQGVSRKYDTNLRTNEQEHDLIIYDQNQKPLWRLVVGKALIY